MDREHRPALDDNRPSQKHALLSLFANSSDIVCLLDHTAKLLATNPAGTALFGDTDTQESDFWTRVPNAGAMESVWRSREEPDTADHVLAWHVEGQAPRWFAWKLSLTETKEWLLVGHEVSAAENARLTLQTERDRLASFLDNAADGLFIHDMEGRILDANRAACAMLGYTREELLQINVSDMDPSVERRKLGGIWKRIQPGQPFSVESTNRRKDGTTFPIEARGGLFGPPDNLLMMTMTRDIRERKRQENARKALVEDLRNARDQAMQANQFKSEFLANMSHELRTPLNAILGYTELLGEELDEAGMSEHSADAKKIHQAGSMLLSLVNDILDLSKIEAGKMELHLEEFPARLFVDDLVALMTPMFNKAGNTLHIHHTTTITTLYADQARLSQSLLNLLSNANKFTKKGEVTLTLQLKEEGDETWQEFIVQDTGVGIPTEQLESLFAPFSQADNTVWQTYGGTGLGLTISQQFCRLMGGDISVVSHEGEGACFTIKIPTQPPTPAPPEWSDPAEVESIPGTTTEQMLLIIDDSTARHDQILRYFTTSSLQVRGVLTGQEGIKCAQVYLPNFVLLDMRLPNDDAWAVLQHFMIDPLLAKITLVVCTTPKLKERCLLAGANAYLPQDYEPSMLLALLQKEGC